MMHDKQLDTADIEPVITSISIEATPTRAFEFFTGGMSRWWLPTQSASPSRPPIHQDDPVVKVVPAIEPWVGGRWYERGTDGSEYDWGRVLAWEPPIRLILAWQIDAQWHFDPTLLTEVEVRFDAQASGATKVNVGHRRLERYGAAATTVRDALASSNGWRTSQRRLRKVALKPCGGNSRQMVTIARTHGERLGVLTAASQGFAAIRFHPQTDLEWR
jgi:uncharacterized protein YndB with AHSA1/START domain